MLILVRYSKLTLLSLVLAGPLPAYAGVFRQQAVRFDLEDAGEPDTVKQALAQVSDSLKQGLGVEFKIARTVASTELDSDTEALSSRSTQIKNHAVREALDACADADKEPLKRKIATEQAALSPSLARSPTDSPVQMIADLLNDGGLGLDMTLPNRDLHIKASVGAKFLLKF